MREGVDWPVSVAAVSLYITLTPGNRVRQSGTTRHIKCLIGKLRDRQTLAVLALSLGRPFWENRGRNALPSTSDPGRAARPVVSLSARQPVSPSVPFLASKGHTTTTQPFTSPTVRVRGWNWKSSHTVGIMRDPR